MSACTRVRLGGARAHVFRAALAGSVYLVFGLAVHWATPGQGEQPYLVRPWYGSCWYWYWYGYRSTAPISFLTQVKLLLKLPPVGSPPCPTAHHCLCSVRTATSATCHRLPAARVRAPP